MSAAQSSTRSYRLRSGSVVAVLGLLASLVGGYVTPAAAAPVLATDTQQSGAAFGFGRNDVGQIKPGTTANQLAAVALPAPGGASVKDAVSVAAGNGFSIWVDHNGKVWSIGDNSNGQSGSGSTATTLTVPTAAVGFGGANQPKAVKVVAYGNAVEVLDNGGNVWQWGQVANSNTTLTTQKTPTQMTFPTGVTKPIVDIAAGSQFALALDSASKPYAWGRNDRGQLGTNTTNTVTNPAAAVYKPPTLLSGQTAMIEAGKDFALYVVSGPAGVDVYTWGAGTSYQLGNNSNKADVKVPTKAFPTLTSSSGALKALSLSAGGTHTLLLTSDGTVRTWGINGVTTNATPAVVTSALFSGTHVPYLVAAGDGSSFVANADGTVASWGTDTTGQLGLGVTGTTATPTPVSALGAIAARTTGPPVQLVSRNGETYALVDAEIVGTPDRAGFDFGAFPTSPVSGQSAPAHAFTLTNISTKALSVTSLGVEGPNAADFATSGSPCTTMAIDGSCSITVTFRPTGTGQRNATLALRTSNTLGTQPLSYFVPLVGAGYTSVQGVANYKLDVTPDTPTVLNGRGNRLQVRNIDPSLIPEAVPDVGASTIPRLALPTIPSITIPRLTIPRLTVGEIAPQASTIPRLTIPRLTLAQIGLPSIGQLPLSTTIPRLTIPRLTIPRLPLLAEGGWEEFVKDYPGLAGLPVNTITFAQLFAQPANANVAAPADRITLDRLDLANSVLAQASFFALLMGTQKLSQYPVNWCDELAPFESPAQCTGAGLDRSLLDLSITEAIPIEALQASAVTLGSITPDAAGRDKWANAVWPLIALDAVAGNVAGTHLNVPLSTIPQATLQTVLDCSKTSCTDLGGRYLGDADVVAAVRPTAKLGDLGSALNGLKAAWVTELFLDRSEFPWELLSRQDVPLQAFPNRVKLTADLDVNCRQASDTHFGFDLPAGYDYVPGTATLTRTRGAGTVGLEATTNAQHVDVVVPDSVFAANGAIDCTNDSGHLRVNLSVLPPDAASSGLKATGTVRTGTLSSSGTQSTGISTTGLYDPPSSNTNGPTFQPDELVLGHLNPGETQYLNIDVAPWQTMEVSLSQMATDSDLDLVVYHPVGAVADPVLAGNATPVPVPYGESASQESTAQHTNTQTAGGALQDVPLLPDRLVAGVSALRDSSDEQMSTLTRAGSNNRYTIQVSGFNRSGGDYTVRVRVSIPQNLGPCTVVPPTVSYPANASTLYGGPSGPTPTGLAAGDDTVVLVNPSRLEAYYPGQGQAVLDAAYNLTHLSGGVKGQVVRVDGSAAVNQAYQAWDQSPCDPTLSNEVVKQINTLVFGILAASPNTKIRYVTILGGHAIVPHALLVDSIRDANERDEAGDLAITGNNPLSNAFALSRFPSDTPFGSPQPLLISGQVVYVPTMAVGRVGETADSIKAQLDQFRALSGVADPPTAAKSATVTDYDFLSSGGDRVASSLSGDYTVDHTLTGKTATWSKADLLGKWLGRSPVPPSIGVLNMHYDQYRALPAKGNASGDVSELYMASDVANGPPLTQRIVLTVGCHSALDVPNQWLKSTASADQVLRAQDWAQRYGEKGLAVMIGNLGYGYADTNVVAYSALEQQLVAEALAQHYDLGTSLVQAQQAYLTRAPSLSPYDLKSLQQMVLWGLPQYRTTSAPAAIPPAPPTGTLAVDPATSTASYTQTVTPQIRTVDDGGSSHMEARLSSSAPWQSFGASGAPILPMVSVPLIAQQGWSVRSVLPQGLAGTADSSGFATFARAGSDTGLPQQPTLSGDWPATPWHVLTQPLPQYGLEASTLAWAPARIHLDGTAPGHASQMQMTSGTFLVTYGAPGRAYTPDTFTSISASHTPASGSSGALTSWAVETKPAQGAHTKNVWILARTQSGSGPWVRADLASTDGLHWTATKSGFLGDYIVVALNDLGFGSISTLKGGFWEPGDLSALHISGSQGDNEWYNGPTTVTADTGTIYDNGSPVGSSATLTNGEHQLSLLQSDGKFVSANGQTSYLYIKVDSVVPIVTITLANPLATFAADNGQPHPNANSSQPYTVSVTYGPSGPGGPVTVNGVPLSGSSGTLDTSKVGQRSIAVSAPSGAGLTGTATKDYRVVYRSASFVSPVASTNTVLPIFSYQYTFTMLDDANRQVTTIPSGTSFANTFTNAATCSGTGSINLPSGISGSAAPTYDTANQRWQWSLVKSGTQCQQLTFSLPDGWTKITTNVVLL
jgi:alpha-tubulin suppressor-like RCC1 family protein